MERAAGKRLHIRQLIGRTHHDTVGRGQRACALLVGSLDGIDKQSGVGKGGVGSKGRARNALLVGHGIAIIVGRIYIIGEAVNVDIAVVHASCRSIPRCLGLIIVISQTGVGGRQGQVYANKHLDRCAEALATLVVGFHVVGIEAVGCMAVDDLQCGTGLHIADGADECFATVHLHLLQTGQRGAVNRLGRSSEADGGFKLSVVSGHGLQFCDGIRSRDGRTFCDADLM